MGALCYAASEGAADVGGVWVGGLLTRKFFSQLTRPGFQGKKAAIGCLRVCGHEPRSHFAISGQFVYNRWRNRQISTTIESRKLRIPSDLRR
jgi:hypothetical protein